MNIEIEEIYIEVEEVKLQIKGKESNKKCRFRL